MDGLHVLRGNMHLDQKGVHRTNICLDAQATELEFFVVDHWIAPHTSLIKQNNLIWGRVCVLVLLLSTGCYSSIHSHTTVTWTLNIEPFCLQSLTELKLLEVQSIKHIVVMSRPY